MSSHHLARLLINNSEQWGQPRQGLDMKKKKKEAWDQKQKPTRG